eukprot:CCRYP_018351-RA/>CCRYP_018351-RA protein AED:0.10 eAED:0.10 QI:193/1/0.5/1/0/0/2/0/89
MAGLIRHSHGQRKSWKPLSYIPCAIDFTACLRELFCLKSESAASIERVIFSERDSHRLLLECASKKRLKRGSSLQRKMSTFINLMLRDP